MTLTVNIYTHPKQTALSHLNNIYTECLKGYIWFCVFAESKPELGVKAGTLIPNTENLICFWDIGSNSCTTTLLKIKNIWKTIITLILYKYNNVHNAIQASPS